MPSSSSVVVSDVTFAWPDGIVVLDGVTGSFTTGTTGLIGANGAGKSTLLRLIAGHLTPAAGTVSVRGTVELLPQDITVRGSTIGEVLGIAGIRAAIAAVERGEVDPRLFETIGTAWDVDDRARAELAAEGLPDDLDRSMATLSGGEAMLTALTGVRLRGADVALLDEPTNNLDGDVRARLYRLIDSWHGTLIVVSHDVALLDRLDQTCELRDGTLRTFGGPYRAYRD